MSFQAQTTGDRKVSTQKEVMLMQKIHMFFCFFFVFSGPSNSLVASTTFDMREHLAFNRGASTLASIALIVMCSMLTIVSSGPYVSTSDSNVAPPSSLPGAAPKLIESRLPGSPARHHALSSRSTIIPDDFCFCPVLQSEKSIRHC